VAGLLELADGRRRGELGARGDVLQVWMSYGDCIESLFAGFRLIGTSVNTSLCAVADDRRQIYGIQFHSEVAHTSRGGEMLRAFLFEVAGLSPS